MRHITLTYTIQKTISIDLPDDTFTVLEIETKIDDLLREHAPKDLEILEDDYCWSNSKYPIPKGCGQVPPDDCWIEIDGVEWATNGWCVIDRSTPYINEGNETHPWHPKDKLESLALSQLREYLTRRPTKPHTGYFDNRFMPLRQSSIKVYGESREAPGYCYCGDRLVAIIMPVIPNEHTDRLFTFN